MKIQGKAAGRKEHFVGIPNKYYMLLKGIYRKGMTRVFYPTEDSNIVTLYAGEMGAQKSCQEP